MFAKHGVTNPIRAKVSGTKCLACCIEFWERSRLLKHLEPRKDSINHCSKYYSLFVPDLPPEQAQELRDVEAAERGRLSKLKKQGLCRGSAACPCVRYPGPRFLYDPSMHAPPPPSPS